MHDLTAKVTSSLLPFPGVTTDALGEDEITLDSVLHGRFTVGRTGLAWLACGPHLEVVHAMTGERLSAYCFSGGGEHPPTVLAARDFSWLKRSGLLVGLEEAEGSVLCLYDLGLSRVVKAVVIPGRITAIEPLVSYGGASTLTQHLHQSLRWFFGIAAVVTDLGHVLLVDLCLDDLSCSQSELEASDLQVVTKSPAEIPRLREVSTRQGRHLCLQLNGPTGVGATALQYISRTNQLAVGFSDGYLQLWNMKALKKEYHSQLEGGRVPVHAFTFQEPENDPRNCCYLWAVQSSQDLEGDVVSLHLLQLAFSERKCLASGKILYEGLEYCEERYSQELSGTAFPLRAQATNTRLLSCQTIEKFRPHPDREDSINEAASPDTSVSIFSWQVKAYGQRAPSTSIGVFDINRWYHAQMPDSLRSGESLQNCPYLAVWSLDPVVQMVASHVLLDVVVHERSLSRGMPFTCPPPEQYFNPTTYNFDATCLLNSGIVHLTCSGYQKETLSFLKKAAPCSSDIISTSYSRCLMSGLLSPRLSDTQASSLSQEEQLDAILSTAVETSSLGLITGCIKQWTAEEQPGSALNLRYILDWAWNKVVQTKEELDGICAPLFDSSSNFTDPQTMQLLQHSQRLLSNLSTIFHCLLSEAQELTQKGLVGLINKNMVSSLISKYAQVVLWFCRTGLLPEGSDDDALQISRPVYSHSVISSYYTMRREELARLSKGKWCTDCLMIDGLVGQCGEHLTKLWKRDEGGTGLYPPLSLHALLDIYLLEDIEETVKHAIVIYLLLDVMYSFHNKEGASVESFPTAFAIPVGLVKLVQGIWLLDHDDHQSSLELLLHPAASQCQFAWQHERVLQALMCQGQYAVALRYFHMMKPPISSTAQAKLCLSVLLHNRSLIEAWSLIRQHSNRLNMDELLSFLYESCQELGLIRELLKLPLGVNEQECLEKFLQGTGGLRNRELLMIHYLQQANYIPALQLNRSLKMSLVNERDSKVKERSNTRNAILDQYGKVLPRVQRKLAMEKVKPYQHPNAIHREVPRPQPLSTITKRSANDKVMSRAGFINNVLVKIEEVWSGKGATPQSSPAKSSPRAADAQTPRPSSLAPLDPFLGTPITRTSKLKSRLMDLVVQPSCQTPRPLLSPPRPPSSWVSPKSNSKAPELSLLQTPQVVKRARALAASVRGFSGFTPQSILRSSLRPTPVATPSASPGRSISPPRTKESRITFMEEADSPEPEKSIRWTNGVAADSEISLLSLGPRPTKAPLKAWPADGAGEEDEVDQPSVRFLPPEGGIPSPELRPSESDSSPCREAAADSRPSEATQAGLSLSLNNTQESIRSTDTTLEYYDAPQSERQDGDDCTDDIVTINIRGLNHEEEPPAAVPKTPSLTLEEEEQEAKEIEVLEDVMDTSLEQEEEASSEEEAEQEDEADGQQETAVTIEHVETTSYIQVCYQVPESTDSAAEAEPQDQPAADGQDVQSEATESAEIAKCLKLDEATEAANQLEELEQSTDLTEFVERHLFGSPSTPLTRSGIHESQTSINSEVLGEDEQEGVEEEEQQEQPPAESPIAVASQKSAISVTSSEPTGTDSNSVVSFNESEELSSPESEEEDGEDESEEGEEDEGEEEEEEEGEEDDDDSDSEVEIIEEVQGNGRLPPLQHSSVFVQQTHTHFLPSLSEQEAAEFSLLTPDAEMKLEADMEGEVVMVRLGATEAGVEADEVQDQGSSYMELKPSTTLLVPLELVEGQDGLMDSAQLGLPDLTQAVVTGEPSPDTPGTFSLMLDMDEDEEKEGNMLPLESELQFADPSVLSAPMEAGDEFGSKPEMILLGSDDQDLLMGGEALEEEEQMNEILDGVDQEGAMESEPVKSPEPSGEPEEAAEQAEADAAMLAEDQEPAESSPVREPATDVDGPDMTEENNAAEPTPPEQTPDEPPSPEQTPDEPPSLEQTPDEPPSPEQTSDEPPSPEQTPDEPPSLEQTPDEPPSPEQTSDEPPSPEHAPVEATPPEPSPEPTPPESASPEPTEADPSPAEVEENGPVHPDVPPSAETMDEQENEQENKASDAGEENNKAVEEKTEVKKLRGRPKKPKDVDEEKPVADDKPEEATAAAKKAQSTPTRKSTRASTVTFVSPVVEPQQLEEAGEAGAVVHASPSRTPRRGRQSSASSITPRRSTRNAQPQAPKEEVLLENAAPTDASTSKASSPGRRRVSQRASPGRGSSRSQSQEEPAVAAPIKEEPTDEAVDVKASQQSSSRRSSPGRQRSAQSNTPRRSSRRTASSTTATPAPLEVLVEEEQEEQDEVFLGPVKRSSRKTRLERPEVEPVLLEVEEEEEEEEIKRQRRSSPGRTTRQSSRVTLSVQKHTPQSGRRTRSGTSSVSAEAPDSSAAQTKPVQRASRKLWDHPEEELTLLDSPLEVHSETPIADALIKRLQDEEGKQEGGIVVTKMVRTSRKSSKSAVEQVQSLLPESNDLLPKAEPDEGDTSFIYSPARRRTRAKRTGSPEPSEPPSTPVTRSRRKVNQEALVLPQNDVASEEEHMDEENAAGASKPRKTSKRTAKSKSVSEPPPEAEAAEISPMASPAEPLPRSLKRIADGNTAPSNANLRRKRIMDKVFTKPVTRRKKL